MIAGRLHGYLERRRGDVASGRHALARGDYRSISLMAHRVGGTGASYGMPGLTLAARATERAARREDACSVGDALDWMERVVREAQLVTRKSEP